MSRLRILGVPVDPVTESEAVLWVKAAIAHGPPRQVVTVNPEFVMRAQVDPPFRAVLEGAGLAIPDGAGLLWAARHRGQRIPERVAGVDLVRALAREGAASGWRFFLLGAGPGVAAAAAAALRRDSPALVVTGTLSGSPQPAEDEATAAAVRAAGCDLLLVAFGAPTQDLWIARNLDRTGARVAIGVGGAFDFLSGQTHRAPAWMRERGLEWLHRLAREPWRWRRMLALPRFVYRVLREA
ncbi:MAG TPA: WecB/TagA/CpsF family glycosyltransferase [Candidatus Limnocylindrales bacterium]|nr:WecB/TagA/CpsF family glycosyltransferase [Candidatus Limnocylindrales bacterium]